MGRMAPSLPDPAPGIDTRRRAMGLLTPLAALAAVLPVGLAACATMGDARVPRGERLGLAFQRSSSAAGTPIDNLSTPTGASYGLGAGAVAGALSGLSCGILAVICVPAGLLIGGLAGAGGGAVVGLTGALPADKAQALQVRLLALLQRNDLMASLQDNVTLRAGRIWTLDPAEPRFMLTTELKHLGLTSTRSEQIGLRVGVRAVLDRQRDGRREPVGEKLFEFAPESSPLSAWLDEQSDVADTLLQACGPQQAAQIVAEFSRDGA